MIGLRISATAYLMNNGEFLMIKRSGSKRFAPGLWAGVGGHLEPDEINSPHSACLREIREETGINEKDIKNLQLKYIILRRSKDEIRVQYIFFGYTNIRDVIDTDEGKLFWVKESELLDRNLSVTTRISLEHFLKSGYESKEILVGTVSVEDNKPVMHWNAVQDWEGI